MHLSVAGKEEINEKLNNEGIKEVDGGLFRNTRMPLKLCVCVLTAKLSAFPSWSRFVVVLFFFFFFLFHSSTVRSYCQLADSCFIILFQNLNPKT